MKERGILFSAPMVRALLNGTKTQTRRIVKPQPDFVHGEIVAKFTKQDEELGRLGEVIKCPYGQPTDILWVRETWRTVAEADSLPPRDLTPAHRVWFDADIPHQPGYGRFRPGMFMPRWASRITLEVTAVRVERLQDISEEDAMAEGVAWRERAGLANYTARKLYRTLWESINGPGSWDANPHVWAISFRRVTP